MQNMRLLRILLIMLVIATLGEGLYYFYIIDKINLPRFIFSDSQKSVSAVNDFTDLSQNFNRIIQSLQPNDKRKILLKINENGYVSEIKEKSDDKDKLLVRFVNDKNNLIYEFVFPKMTDKENLTENNLVILKKNETTFLIVKKTGENLLPINAQDLKPGDKINIDLQYNLSHPSSILGYFTIE